MQDSPNGNTLGDLYRDWGASLLRFASTLATSPQVAEDLVHDVFLVLQQRLATGERIDNYRAWTITVVRNLAHKERRGAAKLVEMPSTIAAAPAPQHEIIALRGLLSPLTEREQEVLILRMESLSYREIADELGVAVGTVSALVARSLAKLKDVSRKKAQQGGRSEAASR